MALSNTAVPKYYGQFRDAVIRGEIPVCKEMSMAMNRIDSFIANKGIYYDDLADGRTNSGKKLVNTRSRTKDARNRSSRSNKKEFEIIKKMKRL